MGESSQQAVVAFLSSPSTFGGVPVECVETHASYVFLAGSRAYKLKRAVRYDYLDFSTVDKRRAMSAAELRLNQRAAPAIYRRLRSITRRDDGGLEFDGPGEVVDWTIEMERFDQDCLLDRLAARGALDLSVMPQLAEAVAAFHAGAARRPDHGGFAGMIWVIDGNAAGFASEGAGILDPGLAGEVTAGTRDRCERDRDRLEQRRTQGFVRECHGDLHLRNIVLLEGRPTLFDGVEFNDEISCIDVLYDTAFLLMDLWQRDLRGHANLLWNRLFELEPDITGLPLLPLFLSCRAAVRAKTNATSARLTSDVTRQAALREQAQRYLALAAELLRPAAARVVAIGGLSGTGKSTIARALAPAIGAAPGAIVLRSDIVRKTMLGAAPLDRLGPEAYTPEVSDRVYATLRERAREVAGAGHAVIVDAVFADPRERDAVARVAREAGVPFQGVWLEAPASVLEARVSGRRGDASDADVAVVRNQVARGAGTMEWDRVDASGPPDTVMELARRALG